MKKLAIIFITLSACLVSFQSAQAATTALTESLLEYEAILDFIGAPNFTTIGPDEFIIDIARLTRRVDTLGIVEYTICTRRVLAEMGDSTVDEDPDHDDNIHMHDNEYIATLIVTPKPGIGPNVVTVVSIEPCRPNR